MRITSSVALGLFALMRAAAIGAESAQWDVFETSYKTAKAYTNAFTDVEVTVVFKQGDTQWNVPAFWAGGDTWTVRFAPPAQGKYTYRVECTDKSNMELNGKEQTLQVTAYKGVNPLLQHGFVQVATDRRHFAQADGTPFFWLGDTWWKCLCKRMTWEGFQELTADRKAKGFSVIQIVCGPYPDEGAFEPRWENEGGKPYATRDFSVANPKYFEYADRRIKHLVDAGLVPAIVGAWGRGDCDAMGAVGVAGIKRHWRHVVARYGAYPVVWILAGEIGEGTKWGEGPWAEVAAYLRSMDPYRHPLTCHTGGGRRGAPGDVNLIDYDMMGGSHDAAAAITGNVLAVLTSAYAKRPPMPVLIGETCYEQHMQQGFQDVQRHMFWMYMLNGAAGHTYGAAGIWHASVENDPGVQNIYDWTTWQEGMAFPGAAQIGLGKKLLEQYPWARFEPHPEWAEADCHAAGIPGEVRFIYQPRRNVYNWNGTVVKNLERDVPYHAFYFNPCNAKRYDLGTFVSAGPPAKPFEGHTRALLFADRFDRADGSAWKDYGTPSQRKDGHLVGTKGMVTILEEVNETNLMASVEARSDAEAGIILRFHDVDNYLVAFYTPLLKAIYLHNRVNGEWGEALGRVAVPDIGPTVHLTAAACGDHAALVLTDGKETYYTPSVKVGNVTSGKAGVWLFQIGDRQEYANFELSRTPFTAVTHEAAGQGCRVLFSGDYKTPGVPSPQDWVLVLQRASGLKDWAARTYNDGKGHALPYRLFIPGAHDESKKYPLILYLHGAGARGTDNVSQLTDVPPIRVFAEPANQQKRPCFILAPQCPNNCQWANMPWGEATGAGKFTSLTWPMEASLALLDSLPREYPGIDTSRLYVMGPSMGGYGTWDAVCRFPTKFRAAVPICGGGDPTKVSQVTGLSHLRLWAFHCADDPAVPVGRTREMIAAMKALNGMAPRYTEFPIGGHDAYSRALTDINLHEWLFDSTRTEPEGIAR